MNDTSLFRILQQWTEEQIQLQQVDLTFPWVG